MLYISNILGFHKLLLLCHYISEDIHSLNHIHAAIKVQGDPNAFNPWFVYIIADLRWQTQPSHMLLNGLCMQVQKGSLFAGLSEPSQDYPV